MLSQRDVIYCYDGSFEGFLSCVFTSFERHEMPWDIWPYSRRETSLYSSEDIVTDQEKAQRVYASIRNKLGSYVHYLVMTGFLNGEDGKEICLLRFLRLVYAQGPRAAAAAGKKEESLADYAEDDHRGNQTKRRILRGSGIGLLRDQSV